MVRSKRRPYKRFLEEAASAKKLTFEDFISQETLDDAVEEVLQTIMDDVTDVCDLEEDDEGDIADALDDALANVGDEGYWDDNEIVIMVATSNLIQKLDIKGLKALCDVYGIDY